MFTYKFVGLLQADNPAPYYYGSLPARPEIGHVLYYDETGNRYEVTRIVGQGLEGKDTLNQQRLADAEIGRGEEVPTVYLKKLPPKPPKKTDLEPTGTSYYEDLKKASQTNRRKRKKGG